MSVKVPTEKSEGFKARMRLGQSIANQLTSVMPSEAVAARLGISKTAVRKIECLALAKIALAMRTAHLKL